MDYNNVGEAYIVVNFIWPHYMDYNGFSFLFCRLQLYHGVFV